MSKLILCYTENNFILLTKVPGTESKDLISKISHDS